MILGENQQVNVVVRGVIIEEGGIGSNLPQDFADQFGQCPRFFYAQDGSEMAQESNALAKAFGFQT